MSGYTSTTTINGLAHTFSRPSADFPSAEIVVDRADGRRLWVNTQYAAISGGDDLSAEERAALVAAGRTYQAERHTHEEAARRAREAADTRAFLATLDEPVPSFPYRTSEDAWDHEDEATWAAMRRHGL